MPSENPDRTLRVQTVLFDIELSTIWRLLLGLEAAARMATDSGVVAQVEWAIGDSTPTPSLGGDTFAALQDASSALARITYEPFVENLGSSGGQNRLADGGDSDILFVLNPDTYPSPNALVELVRALDRPRVGIAEARQIPLEHPKAYDPRTGETGWASGCCMMVWSTLFADLGGFDHHHFLLHCDDVDFSWRARAAGWRIVVAPLATVFHDKRPRRDASWPAPDAERYHAVLGRLMLATRWGRPDVVQETIATVEAAGEPVQQRAVAEFSARVKQGRAPAAVQDSSVAEFVDGEYAVHWF